MDEKCDAGREGHAVGNALLAFFTLLCLVYSGWMAYLAVADIGELRDALASLNWPTASATTNLARAQRHEAWHRTRRTVTYHPDVEYVYQVNGVEYVGRRVHYANISSPDEYQMERKLDPIRPPRKYLIHYKPSDPSVSVITPGASEELKHYAYLSVVPSAVSLIFGAYLGRCLWRHNSENIVRKH